MVLHKFGVDPTFTIGQFDVLIGLVMIQYRKTYATYLYFASTILGLRQNLTALHCSGTDALYSTFQLVFPLSIHLQYMFTETKLSELHVNSSTQQVIIDVIFGKQVNSEHFEGLIDVASSAASDKRLSQLIIKWKTLVCGQNTRAVISKPQC